MYKPGDIVLDAKIKTIDSKNSIKCECVDCGKIYILKYDQLRKRKTYFCNCTIDKEFANVEMLTDQVFGDLKVIGINVPQTQATKEKYSKRLIIWDCECQKCHTVCLKTRTELLRVAQKGSSGCGHCNGIDLVGQKFGRLTVLEDLGVLEYGKRYWKCVCDCGNVIPILHGNLISGNKQSCGCLHREQLIARNKRSGSRNGDSQNPKYARIYRIWNAMHHRCESTNDVHYKNYGGRGIKVCEEWNDWTTFRDWAINNGYDDELTIDRIDYDGNYTPLNCRWITQQEQSNNTSANKRLTYHGRTQTLSEWCNELGLIYSRVKARLNTCNYTVEEAFELDRYQLREVT